MTSAERTIALVGFGKQIAAELNKLNAQRPWTFVEPAEDTYSVYLRNAGKGRIYLEFMEYEKTDRIAIRGYLNVGKNNSYVDVYEKGLNGSWDRAYAPGITVATKRGCQAIAKDIAKRFLPEYLRVLALAEDKVSTDAEYEAKIAANIQRLAAVAGVKFHSEDGLSYRGEARKDFTFRVDENSYYHVTASANDCSMKLDTLSFEQAEHIIQYLKRKEK